MPTPDLNDKLRCTAVSGLEVGQLRAEVTRRLQVSSMVVFRLWQQFQTPVTIVRKTVQGLIRMTTPMEDLYVALKTQVP
ncbi:hypothetical protein TNCV_3527581 [Trichonephila clavipes]|nr:hypothetical protein TNCV_3527581 [Trichonephila clavipes]